MRKQAIIMGIIALVVVGVGAVLLWQTGPSISNEAGDSTPLDEQKLVRADSAIIGSQDAKVKLVEFGDYQCPACKQFEPIFKSLLEKYKDNPDVAFVFRNFPLTMHQLALPTARAAEASGLQGKFWEMHDLLYERQNDWINAGDINDLLVDYAKEIGLDEGQFKADIQSSAIIDKVNRDLEDGKNATVQATPTIFVGGVKVERPNFDTLTQAIDTELQK